MHATRGEIMRILRPGMRKDGAISPADRTYLVKLVSARTGLSQTDAEQRADQVVTQAKTTADQARKSAAKFSLLAGCVDARRRFGRQRCRCRGRQFAKQGMVSGKIVNNTSEWPSVPAGMS